MKLKAIVFDLDGTLLDTLDDLTAAVNHALFTFGYGGMDKARVRRYVGNGVPKLMERVLHFVTTGEEPDMERGGFSDRGLFNACLAVFTEYYNEHNADLTRPYDGVTEMLNEVSGMGLKTAIVTNKYNGAAQELGKRFFGTVDIIVGAQPGVNPKPAPDGVYKALEILGVGRSDAVYVGDGETDMMTAKNCGMPAVAVTWGFRDASVLSEFRPRFMIDSPSELIPTLRSAGLVD